MILAISFLSMVDGPAFDRAVFIFDHQDRIILNEKGCDIAPLKFPGGSVYRPVPSIRLSLELFAGQLCRVVLLQSKVIGITLDEIFC